jgi:hypothetical protein
MRRCRSVVFLAAGGAWILMVLCGSVVSAGDKREKPTWQPQRPAISTTAQPRNTDTNERLDATSSQNAADGRRGESRPAAFDPSAASNQRAAQVESALIERPAGDRNVGGDEIVLEPFADPRVAVDFDSSWSDGAEYSYSASSFGTDLPVGGVDAGILWQAVSHLQLFAGVHGFKGPTDLGRNGNFGFHEGLNFGAPLWDLWGYGYQAGFQAVHSNFAGNQAVQTDLLPRFDAADRNQIFFTAGLFKRPLGTGLQTGVAFDLFYDSYYDRSTLYQIRSETALVLGDLREIG